MRKILPVLLVGLLNTAMASPNTGIDIDTNVGSPKASEGGINNSGSGNSSVLNINNTGPDAGQSRNITHTNVTNQAAPSSTTSNVKYTNAPSMGAPFLTATPGNDICLGSMSGAVSGMGFGFSGGSTVVDANCVLLKNSQRLQAMGLGQSAAIMFITKSDSMLDAIALGDPKVYLDIVSQQVSVLQSKIAISQDEGKNTYLLDGELEEASFKLKVAQHRIGKLAK